MTPDYCNLMLSNELVTPIIDTRRLCPGFVDSMLRFQEYFNSGKADEIIAKNMLSTIVGEMISAVKLQPRLGNLSLEKITRYVMEHFEDPDLTLEVTAAALGFNSTYLSHLFTSTLRVNFVSFVNSFRINKAKHLLQKSDMKMNDVVASCGFGSQRTFNRVFRNFVGMSPGEFRIADMILQM